MPSARNIRICSTNVFWSFVVLLAVFQIFANFGPPPSSPEAMAVMALVFYAVFALLAALVERFATYGGPRNH